MFQNPLGNNLECYFVEAEVRRIMADFRKHLQRISALIKSRNARVGPFAACEGLAPEKILNSERERSL